MSGSVLVTSVWPAFKDRSTFLLAAILGFHLLLATGFMLYFFHAPPVIYNSASHHTPLMSVKPHIVVPQNSTV